MLGPSLRMQKKLKLEYPPPPWELRYVPSKNLKAGHHWLTGGTMLVQHYMLAGNGLT